MTTTASGPAGDLRTDRLIDRALNRSTATDEMAVLGAMMASAPGSDYPGQIRALLAPGNSDGQQHFTVPAHRLVWRTILALQDAGQPFDLPSVWAQIPTDQLRLLGNGTYLHDLIEACPAVVNGTHYARNVAHATLLRGIAGMAADAADRVLASSLVDAEDVLETVRGRLDQLVPPGKGGILVPWEQIGQEALDEMSRLEELAQLDPDENSSGWSTPWPDVDRLLGQVAPGSMIICAGRPGMGKSIMGRYLAQHLAMRKGLPALLFSLEMGRLEIALSMMAAGAKIPLHAIKHGTLSEDDWVQAARYFGQTMKAPLAVDDTVGMNIAYCDRALTEFARLHGRPPVAYVFDYLQLGDERGATRQEKVAAMSRGHKLLAKKHGTIAVCLSQLNREPDSRPDKRPQLSDLRESGCLTAETRVLRADTGAETTMGDLFESGARDVPVWALDDRLKYVRRHLTHVFSTGEKPVFRLRLASGREVRATANHPFLTYDGWTALGDLAVGGRIATPRHICAPEQVATWDDREVILLAHLLGDGSMLPGQSIRYASMDEANLEAVRDAATFFGVTAARDEYEQARCTTLRLVAPYRLTHGKRNPIAAWVDSLGLFGKRSHEKFVPASVFSLPKDQIALFLRHLWATDGSVWIRPDGGKGPIGRIYYASTSRRLVDDVARLLWRFGIQSRIKTVGKAGHRDHYHLYIYGVGDQEAFCRVIGVNGKRGEIAEALRQRLQDVKANTNVDTIPRAVRERVRDVLAERGMTHRQFAAAMGTQFCGNTMWKHNPSRDRIARAAAILQDNQLEMLATNDVTWDEIIAIEPDGVEAVYDATVAGAHNFVANGIAVHNSLEQDADIVILLHRDDYYDKESPRAGEIDFIVAKHRGGPTDTITLAAQLHLSRIVSMAII